MFVKIVSYNNFAQSREGGELHERKRVHFMAVTLEVTPLKVTVATPGVQVTLYSETLFAIFFVKRHAVTSQMRNTGSSS